MSDYRNTPSTHRGVVRPVEQVSMANPYKYNKKEGEWEKICKKYGEEDKSKLPKKEKKND
tara:strand:+ start:584 stop:763 length:180 start_codon:yes stop_codon:yes gene_type:complete